MDKVTQSDHNLVWAELSLEKLLGIQKIRTGDSRKATRKIFLFGKATKENWEDYRTQLNHVIENNYRKMLKKNESKEETEDKANELWDLIEKAIGKAAANNIPTAKIKKDKPKTDTKRRPYQKELKILARLQKVAKEREGREVDEIDQLLYNEQINIINRETEAEVPNIIGNISYTW